MLCSLFPNKMFPNKKAALELSVNMLVVVIISIVVLAGGITLLYKLIGGATVLKEGLDLRTQEEMRRLLVDQGKQVALPFHAATIERGEDHAFWLGVLNLAESQDFKVAVSLSKAVDSNNNEITAEVDRTAVESWVVYDPTPKTIAESEQSVWDIFMDVPDDARTGLYIFDVRVSAAGQSYGNPQKIIVTVQ